MKVPIDMVCDGFGINAAVRVAIVLIHRKTPHGSPVRRLGFAPVLASPPREAVFYQVRSIVNPESHSNFPLMLTITIAGSKRTYDSTTSGSDVPGFSV